MHIQQATIDKTRHPVGANDHTQNTLIPVSRFLLLAIAVVVKRLVVPANRHDPEAMVGCEVGCGVDVRGHEQKTEAQPNRKTSVLEETFLRVLFGDRK